MNTDLVIIILSVAFFAFAIGYVLGGIKRND